MHFGPENCAAGIFIGFKPVFETSGQCECSKILDLILWLLLVVKRPKYWYILIGRLFQKDITLLVH